MLPAELMEAEWAAGFACKEAFCGAEICLVIDTSCYCFLSGPSHGLILLWVDLNPEEEQRAIERNGAVGFATVCSWVCGTAVWFVSVSNLPGFFCMLRTTASVPCVTLQRLW